MNKKPSQAPTIPYQIDRLTCAWRLWLALAMAAAVLGASVRSIPAQTPVNPVVTPEPIMRAGRARLDRLGPIFVDGAGMFVAARAGDWRLSNELVSLTFASVDPDDGGVSLPVGGLHSIATSPHRYGGALIDVAADGMDLDFIRAFTQGVGLDEDDPIIVYDLATPVEREGEVGIRFEGPIEAGNAARVETTWWLAEGRRHARIETRLIQPEPPKGREWTHEETHYTPDAPPALWLELTADDLCDVGRWGAAQLLAEDIGLILPTGGRGRSEFYSATARPMSVCIAPVGGEVEGVYPTGSQSRVRLKAAPVERQKALPQADPDPDATLLVRDFWVVHGSGAEALGELCRARAVPTTRLSGQIVGIDTEAPIAGAEVRILRAYTERIKTTQESPRHFAQLWTDEQGRYALDLPPANYGVEPHIETFYEGTLNVGVGLELKPNEPLERDLKMHKRTGVRVRVVDAQSGRGLAARLRFDAIAPTRSVTLGPPLSARDGYMNNAYVDEAGGVIHLPPGHYTIYATHGPRYRMVDVDLDLEPGTIEEITLKLDEMNPTPGWLGFEIGAQTDATPGCRTTAEDLVLMADAEDIDWLVSGDFEALTDFGPLVEQLGAADRMGHSRGFRTLHPDHPEWGPWLIWPVAADAPDPKSVRKDWYRAKSAKKFIAALRRHYPGALIQCEQPWTLGEKMGYFTMEGKNLYECAWEPNPDLELDIDALNLMPGRVDSRPRKLYMHWNTHMMAGRRYLPSTSAYGRTVQGAEPGYPRLLVQVGTDDPSTIDETAWLKALEARRVQVTTGLFAQFEVDGEIAGGLTSLDPNKTVRLRVTAPNWQEHRLTHIDKEGIMQMRSMNFPSLDQAQRFPDPGQGGPPTYEISFEKLYIQKHKDTLLGVHCTSDLPIRPGLPACPTQPEAMTFVFPIVVDADGDGRYSGIPAYVDRGK